VAMAHMLSSTEEMQNFITEAVALGMERFILVYEARMKIEVKEVFNLTEAANYLNMSPHTLRKKVDDKKITYIQDERVLQFRKQHLDDYLDKYTYKN